MYFNLWNSNIVFLRGIKEWNLDVILQVCSFKIQLWITELIQSEEDD